MSKTIFVGTEESFEANPMQVVESDGKRFLICKTAEGIFCIQDKCSHADVKLSKGEIDGDEIVCPAHGARFCIKTGEARCMPAVVGIKTYQVEVKDGEVRIVV